jgi:hypothetical protein
MRPDPSFHSYDPSGKKTPRKIAAGLLRYARSHSKVVRFQAGHYLLENYGILKIPRRPPPGEWFDLHVRLTRKYRIGWDFLDKSHNLGEARIIKSGRDRSDHDGFRRCHLLEVRAPGYRPENIEKSIFDSMSFGCNCEHDCCGHFFGQPVKIRRLSPTRYAVIVSGSRNL